MRRFVKAYIGSIVWFYIGLAFAKWDLFWVMDIPNWNEGERAFAFIMANILPIWTALLFCKLLEE